MLEYLTIAQVHYWKISKLHLDGRNFHICDNRDRKIFNEIKTYFNNFYVLRILSYILYTIILLFSALKFY